MKVLSLDTSTSRGSIALLEGRELVGELRISSQETHSVRMLAGIEFLLSSAGWRLSELELVAAGIGPGSFTGIRIGVATALGLAQSLSIPYAGISGMDAMAHQVPGIEGRLGVAMDAQRSQVYFAEYCCDKGRVRRKDNPVLMYPATLQSRLRRAHIYLIGDGAIRYARELDATRLGWPRLVDADPYLAAALGRLAVARPQVWKSGGYVSSEPLYIRPPDALKPRKPLPKRDAAKR